MRKIWVRMYDGSVVRVPVRQPPAPRPLTKWLDAARKAAINARGTHYAIRYHDAWHIHGALSGAYCVIRTMPSEAAAEMYLRHRKP